MEDQNLENLVVTLRCEIQQKNLELQRLQASFDEYTESSIELESELENEVNRLEKKVNQLTQTTMNYEDTLAIAKTNLQSVQYQYQSCEKELEEYKEKLKLSLSSKQQLEQEQDELITQVRILQATESELSHRLERVMEEKVFLLNDQDQLKKEMTLESERYRTEILELKSELVALQRTSEYSLETLDYISEISGDQSIDGDHEYMKHQERAESLQTTDTEHYEEDEMDEVHPFHELQQDHEDRHYNHLRTSFSIRDADDRENLIESLQEEIEILSLRLNEETSIREELEAEIVQLQEHVAQTQALETEMMEMTDEIISKAQDIKTRDIQIQALDEQVTSLKLALTTLQEQVSESQNQGIQWQEETKLNETERIQLQDELKTAQMRCADYALTIQELQTKIENDGILVNETTDQLNRITRKLEESDKLRKELELQLRDKLTELKENRQEIAGLYDKTQRLQDDCDLQRIRVEELEVRVDPNNISTDGIDNNNEIVVQNAEITKDLEAAKSKITLLEHKVSELEANNQSLRHLLQKQKDAQADPPKSNSHELIVPTQRVSTNLLQANYSAEELASKYISERIRNASLLSRLQTVCGNIQVYCRIRPLISEEVQKGWGTSEKVAVTAINQSDVAAMDIKVERVFGKEAEEQQQNGSTSNMKVFTFDRILGPEETQDDVFREVEPIAQSVVEGFKACIFAYGQTGSGKTYTMEGTPENPGINYRVVSHLFESLCLRGSIYHPKEPEEPNDDVDITKEDTGNNNSESDNSPCYHVQVGVLDIYNENLRDLIDNSQDKTLDLRMDADSGDITVQGLTMQTVRSVDDTISVLRSAQKNRAVGKTNVNSHSSRSHCVVVVEVSSKSNSHDITASTNDTYGKLYLVDLAGSESVKKSQVSGEMFRETVHINKSLSALADVLEALDKKAAHVPYRNSKLTYLLQDVLNSSCKTLMIVNVGPTIEMAQESFRSLQLAERVRSIVIGRNSITKNKKDIMSAKKAFLEIQSLKSQLQVSTRKFKQSQQLIAGYKREVKNSGERASQQIANQLRSVESTKTTLTTRNQALEQLNEELRQALKKERELKSKESDLKDELAKKYRQICSKAKVSASHNEAMEQSLKEREAEIRKLRLLVQEARQRSTTSLIPRVKSSPPSRRSSVTSNTAAQHTEQSSGMTKIDDSGINIGREKLANDANNPAQENGEDPEEPKIRLSASKSGVQREPVSRRKSITDQNPERRLSSSTASKRKSTTQPIGSTTSSTSRSSLSTVASRSRLTASTVASNAGSKKRIDRTTPAPRTWR